jgi:isopenicillin-N N-acyltransferase like protein
LGAYTDGHQVLLRSDDGSAQGSLVFTIGGMLALMGVNAQGLGVCVNSLPQLPSAREGLPVTFVIRRLLQAGSADEAAQVVRSLPHATGQHYLLADADSIRSFEASSSDVVEYHPSDPSRVMHTNHPLAYGEASSSEYKTNSIARLRSLIERLMSGRPDAESIKAALSSSDDPDHPVCRVATPASKKSLVTGTTNFTTGSMVCALARGAPVDCWVSAGPPATRGYAQVGLGRRF